MKRDMMVIREESEFQKNNKTHKAEITVTRSFGEADLLELYSGYVAEKVHEKMKVIDKAKEYSA